MTNRYAEDIIRIVGDDSQKSTLGPPEEKPSLPGSRGITYYQRGSSIDTGGTSYPPSNSTYGGGVRSVVGGLAGITLLNNGGMTEAGKSEEGEGSDPKNGALNGGKQTANKGEPENGVITSPEVKVVPIADIIDGVDDATKFTDSYTDLNGTTTLGPKILEGILAKDCNTGNDVEIRLRGDFVPPAATVDPVNGNPISNRWEDANTPPEVIGYQAGYYYETIASYAPFVQYTKGIMQGINAWFAANPDWGSITKITSGFAGQYNAWAIDPSTMLEANPVTATIQSGTPGSWDNENQYEDSWPEDGKYTLRYDRGTFKSSDYDAEAPAEATIDRSLIDFCFGSGRTGTIEVTKDGGKMVYETSMGSPTGTVRVFDKNGQIQAAFDSSSPLLSAYRP